MLGSGAVGLERMVPDGTEHHTALLALLLAQQAGERAELHRQSVDAISMRSACNQHARPSSLSHWMSRESRSASFSLLTKSNERHKFSLVSFFEE